MASGIDAPCLEASYEKRQSAANYDEQFCAADVRAREKEWRRLRENTFPEERRQARADAARYSRQGRDWCAWGRAVERGETKYSPCERRAFEGRRLQPREFLTQMHKLGRNKAADPRDDVSSNLLRNRRARGLALALLFDIVFQDPWRHIDRSTTRLPSTRARAATRSTGSPTA